MATSSYNVAVAFSSLTLPGVPKWAISCPGMDYRPNLQRQEYLPRLPLEESPDSVEGYHFDTNLVAISPSIQITTIPRECVCLPSYQF